MVATRIQLIAKKADVAGEPPAVDEPPAEEEPGEHDDIPF